MDIFQIITVVCCLLQILCVWLLWKVTECNCYFSQTLEKMLYGYVDDEGGNE